MEDPVKKRKAKKKTKKNVFQKAIQYAPGKGRWLKKLLFDVDGETGTDNRKPLKIE